MKHFIELVKKYHIIVLLVVSIIVAATIDILKPSNISIVEEQTEYIWKNADSAIFRYVDWDETEQSGYIVYKEVKLKNRNDFARFTKIMKPIFDAGGTCGCGWNLFRVRVGKKDFYISWPHQENIEMIIDDNDYGMILSEKSVNSIKEVLISNGVPQDAFPKKETAQNAK